MSETKFTPGPWSIQQWSKDDFGHKAMIHVGEGDNYGNPLCRVFMGGNGALFTSREDVEANAKLIAAAPDLFEALRLALPYIEGAYECAFPDSDYNNDVLEAARAAIAKATE